MSDLSRDGWTRKPVGAEGMTGHGGAEGALGQGGANESKDRVGVRGSMAGGRDRNPHAKVKPGTWLALVEMVG